MDKERKSSKVKCWDCERERIDVIERNNCKRKWDPLLMGGWAVFTLLDV